MMQKPTPRANTSSNSCIAVPSNIGALLM
uniref:Uncharacterized protein n=1 Tax=Arundo donax TaxID=35708 RepID=A0A0A8ZZH1_ARUDO